MTALTGLDRWKMRWERQGMATIPLWPNSKRPVSEAWNVTPPSLQWQDAQEQAGGHWRGNIGVMPGADHLVIDADTPEAAFNVEQGLEGLGLCPPMETTPRGGNHFYLRVSGTPGDFDIARLPIDVGAGELRTRRANVVVACSAIDGKRYQFKRGMVEDIATLPVVKWRDMVWLISPDHKPITDKLTEPPVRLIRRDIPERAARLLAFLPTAPKKERIGLYATRSEAEAGIVAMLILAGWSFDEIEGVFEQCQPGHFAEYKERDRADYLGGTYRNVLTWLASSSVRLQVAESYHAAESDFGAWKGRGGLLERAAYLGMLATCWQFNSWEVRVAELDLAQHAAASQSGVHNAVTRLQAAQGGFRVARLQRPTADTATLWRVSPFSLSVPSADLYNPLNCDLFSSFALPEIWSQSKLGRVAGAVYAVLNDVPITANGIVSLTGRSRRAVFYALKRLAHYELAKGVDGGWVRGKTPLEEVANNLRCGETAIQRRERHQRKREDWRMFCHSRQRK